MHRMGLLVSSEWRSRFVVIACFAGCLCLVIHKVESAETSLHSLLHKHKHSHQTHNKIQDSLINIITSEQIHLSFGEKVNDIVVVWATKWKMMEPYVEYGRDVNFRKSTAESVQFIESNGEGTKYWHRAYLSDLKDGQLYFYRVNSARGTGLASDQFHFTVPSLKMSAVHTVMILADMGVSSQSFQFLVQEALNGGYESVIHLGDIANDLHRGHGVIGDRYLKKIQKMAAQVPYMTCPGNQEKANDYLHYRYRFSMPGSPWPMSSEKLWYSYNLGNVHFVVINTEVLVTESSLKSSQLSWLKNDLKFVSSAQRPKHPWIIMMGHKPMYSSCEETDVECLRDTSALRGELEDLLYRFGVDVYIAGHQHSYERTWPVYKDQAFNSYNYKYPKAPIHLTIGSMGSEYHEGKFSHSPKPWSGFRYAGANKDLFSKLRIVNASHLHWEVLSAGNNQKVDHIWIVQNSHGTFGVPGKDAYKRAMELSNIPLLPPLPPEHQQQRRRQSATFLPIRYQDNITLPGTLSVAITCVVAFFLGLLNGKFRKRLRAMCRTSS